MKRYRVKDKAVRVGGGQRLQLTAEQYADREHQVEVLEKKGQGVIVTGKQPLEFKVGEIVGFVDEPDKAVTEYLEDPKAAEKAEAEAAAVAERERERAEAEAREKAAKEEAEAKAAEQWAAEYEGSDELKKKFKTVDDYVAAKKAEAAAAEGGGN